MQNINREILITKNAIENKIKAVKSIGSSFIYESPVFIDCGNGYTTRTTIKVAIDRINELRTIRREIIQIARYKHTIRPFLTRKEKNL